MGRRTGQFITWALALAPLVAMTGCSAASESPQVSDAPSLGNELYLLLCEHVSGTLYPNDVRGRTTRTVCKNHEPDPHGHTRLDAMRENRERIVGALDAVFAEDAYAEDELTGFLRALIPLFDAPAATLPKATAAVADVIDAWRSDEAALEALARASGRQGYRPLASALGATAAVLRAPALDEFLRALLPELEAGGEASDAWAQLVDALGLELAAYQPAGDEVSTLDVTNSLLLASDEAFAASTPAWLSVRDARGYVRPNPAATGVVDADGDGAWDVNAQGVFVDEAGQALALQAPFATLTEVESAAMSLPRDADGLAIDPAGTRLYEYMRADQTLLSGVGSELKRWSEADAEGRVALLGLTRGASTLLGTPREHEAAFGAASFRYLGHDTALAPLSRMLDVVALAAEMPELDRALILFERVLTDHEDVAARFARALVLAKARADRDDSAQIAHPSNFWDETLTLLKRLSQRRFSPEQAATLGEQSALESLLRAFAKPEMRALGGQIAMMGRYNTYCQDSARQKTSACVDLDPMNINGAVRGAYEARIDRDKPDLPAQIAANVPGNTSQLQAFLGLIGELMDRKLCSKATPAVAMFQAMASDQCDDYPLKGFMAASAGLIGGLLGDLKECGFIELPDMGRAFGQAMMNRSAEQVAGGDPELERRERDYGLDLLRYINNDTMDAILQTGASVGLTLDSMRGLFDNIFRACSGVAEFDTTPSATALARVLFAPSGSRTQVFADTMFPPATVRPYLAGTTRDFDPVDGRADFDVDDPPARLRLSEAFSGALSVWEIPWQFGAMPASALMTSIAPLTYALNQHDFFPFGDAAAEAKGAPFFDSDQYLLNPLVGAFAKHFASSASGYQSIDPNKPYYAELSNLRSYEAMVVDMLGEPSVVANAYLSPQQAEYLNAQENIGLFSALHDLLATLDTMSFEDGGDGIDALSELTERFLNAHAYCAPDDRTYVGLGGKAADGSRRLDGKGACDCDRNGDGTLDTGAPVGCTGLTLRKPLRERGSDTDYVTWERGEKFDGTSAEAPFRALAPIDVLLSTLTRIDEVFEQDLAAKNAFRSARSEVVDTLFETTTLATGEVRFENPHTKALLRATLRWARAQLARSRVAPASDPNGQPLDDDERLRMAKAALRAWASELPARAEAFVSSPVPASVLRFLDDLQKSERARRALAGFLVHAFDAEAEPRQNGARPLTAALIDTLQLLGDRETTPAILHAAARALVPNADEVLSEGAERKHPAPLDTLITFAHRAVEADEASTLAKILTRLLTLDPNYLEGKVAPLDVLLEALSQVHRVEPNAQSVFDRADIAELLAEVSGFLRDDQRGMARMVQIIQHRSLGAATSSAQVEN